MSQFFLNHIDTIITASISFIFYVIIGSITVQKMKDRIDDIDGDKGSLSRLTERVDSLARKVEETNPILITIQKDIVEIKTKLEIYFGDHKKIK